MDNNLNNEVLKTALENVNYATGEARRNNDQITKEAGANTVLKDDSGVAQQFTGLPIEALISTPLIAGARAQGELTQVYIENLEQIAYDQSDGSDSSSGSKKTRTIDLNVDRPVQKDDGTVTTQNVSIKAPLISLVPVPTFTMDEMTVDFDMEVKDSQISSSDTSTKGDTNISVKTWFGLKANISGSVTSDTSHKRETDSSATYKIHARAIQQPPSEGMAKLTALFAQMMEPIPTTNNSNN
jgi:hypothetical protein